ncbi:microfibril-associated glycoprotein 4-like [Mytilus galloprovincialis]|uniref:microfibril-associated glycoprotein 4-like n=1 Tax=Mytilus galloprovincialis TaxID=29158 RepID=UPI003F7C30AA
MKSLLFISLIFEMTFFCLPSSLPCEGELCPKVISMPLMDNMKASLKADIDVSQINRYLKAYIQQEIKKDVRTIIKDLVEKKLNNMKVEMSSRAEEKEMGKVCTDSVECQDNLDCINGRCSCNRSTYWNGIRCDQKLPSECEDISSDKDGIYLVYPKGKMTSRKISVYCIMSGNKKWTVIQKRTDGSMDFYRTWSEYSNGFGRVDEDHWLGNENIYRLSQDGTHELSIVLVDWEGNLMEANYSKFSVDSEEDNYSLSVSGYSGNAGDGMDYHNSKSFYTKDRDNKNGCAVSRHGGWWYDDCYQANLNGMYNGTINESGKYTGLVWFEWKRDYSLKTTLMMIRRKE